jgi:hypothetical protein
MRGAACVLLLASSLAACNYSFRTGRAGEQVVGSGNRKTERREVSGFDRLTVEGAYAVEVACGAGPSLEVEADDNLLPLIKTEVEGGRLRIRGERGMSAKALPRVRLSVPDVKEVEVAGAGEFDLSGVRNEALKISVPGAGRLRASGETGRLEVKVDGAASVDAAGLRARRVSAECNGAGSVSVHATDALDAVVNGVGTINYSGDPPNVNRQVNGIGRISKQ